MILQVKAGSRNGEGGCIPDGKYGRGWRPQRVCPPQDGKCVTGTRGELEERSGGKARHAGGLDSSPGLCRA